MPAFFVDFGLAFHSLGARCRFMVFWGSVIDVFHGLELSKLVLTIFSRILHWFYVIIIIFLMIMGYSLIWKTSLFWCLSICQWLWDFFLQDTIWSLCLDFSNFGSWLGCVLSLKIFGSTGSTDSSTTQNYTGFTKNTTKCLTLST